MLHVILPSQALRFGAEGTTPQRRLMIAVLQRALDDCDASLTPRTVRADAYKDPRTLGQALAFIESRDRTWPYSFDNICDAVGLDADTIRLTILRRLARRA